LNHDRLAGELERLAELVGDSSLRFRSLDYSHTLAEDRPDCGFVG
jgi:hypothetical protein